MTHWLAEWSEGGASYIDWCALCASERDAVEAAVENFELDHVQAGLLERNSYLHYGGTTYHIRIKHCNCHEPWIHEEQMDDEALEFWLEKVIEDISMGYTVFDSCNGYYLYHRDEFVRALGDGVDTKLKNPVTGRKIPNGTELWRLMLEYEINVDPTDWDV